MTAFVHTAIMVFIAEIGDRTQLLAIALAQQYNFIRVFLGITLATILLHLVSVFFGNAISHFLSLKFVNLTLGFLILYFAVLFLKETYDNMQSKSDDDFCCNSKLKIIKTINPIIAIALIFTMAEFADKTMFTTCSLAVKYSQYWQVFWGSSIGLIGADVLAILIFKIFKNYIDLKYANLIGSLIFIYFGVSYVIQGIS